MNFEVKYEVLDNYIFEQLLWSIKCNLTQYFVGAPGRGIPGLQGVPGRRGEFFVVVFFFPPENRSFIFFHFFHTRVFIFKLFLDV